jgi:hypothetical protein
MALDARHDAGNQPLDKLISITAIRALSYFRTVRDRLRSFGVCMGAPSVHISDAMEALAAARTKSSEQAVRRS